MRKNKKIQAIKLKEYRAKWLAEGRCGNCGGDKQDQKFKRCEKCRATSRRYNKARIARSYRAKLKLGLCGIIHCQQYAIPGRTMCGFHTEDSYARKIKWANKNRANKLCACGKPRKEGKRTCEKHWQQSHDRAKALVGKPKPKNRKRYKQKPPKEGKCWCGKPLDQDDRKTCIACRQRMKRNHEAKKAKAA